MFISYSRVFEMYRLERSGTFVLSTIQDSVRFLSTPQGARWIFIKGVKHTFQKLEGFQLLMSPLKLFKGIYDNQKANENNLK